MGIFRSAVSTGWSQTAAIVIAARAVRAFGDGFTALLLPLYLAGLGFRPLAIGLLTTAMLLGSAATTLAVSIWGQKWSRRRLLMAAAWLMLGTGLLFAELQQFWPLLLVGFVGTLNPSGGDVSLFLPLEQALLAHAAPDTRRTTLFVQYSVTGSLMAAVGALFVAVLEWARHAAGLSLTTAAQGGFAFYGLSAIVVFLLYRRLPAGAGRTDLQDAARASLGPSRRRVFWLAGLFSLDAFGGGFLVQSLLALWLFSRFGLPVAAAGAFFFWANVLTAASQLAAGALARRVGLINTMVFTHIPANLCIVAAAFSPNLTLALALLLVRAALSQMDVPTRTSYVMAVVTPAEREAAAGVTSVPRSLAAALSPTLAGAIFSGSGFAWPLVIGGVLKLVYDLLLLGVFRKVRPPEEASGE